MYCFLLIDCDGTCLTIRCRTLSQILHLFLVFGIKNSHHLSKDMHCNHTIFFQFLLLLFFHVIHILIRLHFLFQRVITTRLKKRLPVTLFRRSYTTGQLRNLNPYRARKVTSSSHINGWTEQPGHSYKQVLSDKLILLLYPYSHSGLTHPSEEPLGSLADQASSN